jgi:hypothetical protein
MRTTNQNFTGNFTTSMLNLKDRIGEDSIRDLAPNGLADYTLKNVFSLVKGIQNKDYEGVNTTFVPLISNNRVWGYNQTTRQF